MRGLTYNEQFQRLVDEYMSSGEPWPATARQIAAWGLEQKLWAPQRSALIDQLADHLARAMREEYIIDPQGRSVRAKHAARIKQDAEQLTLWADIRSAEPRHMEIAFQQRRQQIVGDCRQLKTDVDSYNENTNPDIPIQLVVRHDPCDGCPPACHRDQLSCHPERSEGSGGDRYLVLHQILRFAQDDSGKAQNGNPIILFVTVY